MTTRRDFIRTGTMAMSGLAITGSGAAFASNAGKINYISNRPAPEKRKFTSQAVEDIIRQTKAKLKDPKLQQQ